MIQKRALGNTGLMVSHLSLGTVALGMRYGIQGEASGKPSSDQAIALIKAAAEAGITLFDTAPIYGDAEALIGSAIGKSTECIIATKVSLPPSTSASTSTAELKDAIFSSIETSKQALKRDTLDILQVHNLNLDATTHPALGDILQQARERGLVRWLGASVYTEQEALAAIDSGWVGVLQVAYNLLDQRMSARVFDAASACGIGVLTRSALLKGALSPRARHLPLSMNNLRFAVEKTADAFAVNLEDLPQTALQFCLGEEKISSVLIGPGKMDELHDAIDKIDYGSIETTHATGLHHALDDASLIDPRLWPGI